MEALLTNYCWRQSKMCPRFRLPKKRLSSTSLSPYFRNWHYNENFSTKISSIILGSNCGSVKPEINRRYCSYLIRPVMSPSWTGKSKSWSSSLHGTRNPSVVQDFRLGESLRPTDFSFSSAVSSDMLTLQYTHETTTLNNRELSVRTIHHHLKKACLRKCTVGWKALKCGLLHIPILSLKTRLNALFPPYTKSLRRIFTLQNR